MSATAEPPPCPCTVPKHTVRVTPGTVTWSDDLGSLDVLTCWHAQTDTLPWVSPRRSRAPSVVDVTVPFGVWSRFAETPHATVTVRVTTEDRQAGRQYDRTYSYSTDDGGGIEVMDPSDLRAMLRRGARLRGEPGVLDKRRHYVDLEQAAAPVKAGQFYYRLIVPDVPSGAMVAYTIAATTPLVTDAAMVKYKLRAAAPVFTHAHVVAAHVPDGDALPELGFWVVLHRREAGFDHVRVDLLSTTVTGRSDAPRPTITVKVGDQAFTAIEHAAPDADGYVELPLLDRELDCVQVSVPVPADEGFPTVTVTTQPDGTQANPKETDSYQLGLARRDALRLVLINYCIQGLNDLFAYPQQSYTPPRTYMQLTMRDERGAWSSRPGSAEDGEPDGYALTLDAHRYYRVPSLWAFNGPVLTMIAHDCPDDLQELREDVLAGIIVPINAGYGAHRPPYYDAAVNRQELRIGREVIAALLPEAKANGLDVYYPDQRLYKSDPLREVSVYQDAGLVRYLVLDRSTLCYREDDQTQHAFYPTANLDGNHLLSDPGTGCRILPIEDVFRDKIDGCNDDEMHRGKIAMELRQMFIQALASTEHPDSRLMVYADDLDKASGNGWFDGDYTGQPAHFNEKYQAALAWISWHPWVRAVTMDDLDACADLPLSRPLAGATCPSVDPGGAVSIDRYGNIMHFDSWVQRWAATRSPWLERTLEQLVLGSADGPGVQNSLITWPPSQYPDADEGLVDLAWMSFLAGNHELMWNKEPLEGADDDLIQGGPPTAGGVDLHYGYVNARCGVLSPEDFVVAASLQIRNTEVYLNAALWATWARSATTAATFANNGWLIEKLIAARRGGGDGRHWDVDPLPNDLLYNRDVLLVLDRNGGRITHVFVRGDRDAICVSGTPKCYQWTGPGPDGGRWLTCDGGVLENTVATPNHLYIATDVHQSAAQLGWRHEDRPRQPSPQKWLFPDTFDEYETLVDAATATVTYTYGPSRGTRPPHRLTDAAFTAACIQDATSRKNGRNGVVWHHGDPFTKTIHLDAKTITIRYRNAPPGHLVANEFCVDVRAALRAGAFQEKIVDLTGRSVGFTAPGGGRITLTVADGCRLSATSIIPDLAGAQAAGATPEYLHLHRVLTDAVEVESVTGGSFGYSIDVDHP